MGPELLTNEGRSTPPTPQSDVYSMAMVTWEVRQFPTLVHRSPHVILRSFSQAKSLSVKLRQKLWLFVLF